MDRDDRRHFVVRTLELLRDMLAELPIPVALDIAEGPRHVFEHLPHIRRIIADTGVNTRHRDGIRMVSLDIQALIYLAFAIEDFEEDSEPELSSVHEWQREHFDMTLQRILAVSDIITGRSTDTQ